MFERLMFRERVTGVDLTVVTEVLIPEEELMFKGVTGNGLWMDSLRRIWRMV